MGVAMALGVRLIALQDEHEYPIGTTPLVVGRDPASDVPVTGDDISRHHAYFLRTPTGIVVVDTSRHGTFVNGDRVQAERVLEPGDIIQIGTLAFRFDQQEDAGEGRDGGGLTGLPSTSSHSSLRPGLLRPQGKRAIARSLAGKAPVRARLGEWIQRYAPGEIVGLAGALLGWSVISAATESAVAAAYGASLGESLGFYGTIVLREMIQGAYAAGARRAPYGPAQVAATWRGLVIEFGPAELADLLALRPLAMWVGTRALGHPLGVVAGKLLADLAFYLPVVATYELRKSRGTR